MQRVTGIGGISGRAPRVSRVVLEHLSLPMTTGAASADIRRLLPLPERSTAMRYLRITAGESLGKEVPLPVVAEQPIEALPSEGRSRHLSSPSSPARSHQGGRGAEPGATLRERYWNPHDRPLERGRFRSPAGGSLRRRHIEEQGWELLQEQYLDAPLAVELIFKAHRVDFTRPSREQILRDIGMTPDDVSDLLGHVDREQEGG